MSGPRTIPAQGHRRAGAGTAQAPSPAAMALLLAMMFRLHRRPMPRHCRRSTPGATQPSMWQPEPALAGGLHHRYPSRRFHGHVAVTVTG